MKKPLLITFWSLVGIFSYLFSQILFNPRNKNLFLFFSLLIISFLLGIALIFLTYRYKIRGLLKKYLILSGVSASGLLVSVFLHNAIYAMFKNYFDKGAAGDEVVFFIIAVFVCTIAFCVGAIGSMVLFVKTKKSNS